MCRRSLVLAVVLLAPSAVASAEPAKKPNVVIIFVDDLGYADIGPFGATQQKTPHLDRMAAEGMKLTSFYAAPVCSVSRAQMLTGCYGVRVSVPGVYFPAGPQGLNPKEVTLAERLKDLGYATQCVGKWHLGDQPEFLPTRQGFDHYLGIPYSNDMQKKSKETGERVVPLLRDDKVEELLTDEKQSRIVERYTEEAVKFITANKDRPFFLYLPHTAVHTPIHAGETFRGKSANGRFGDWVEEVDGSVGRVLDTLRELKLAENTLVVFTSDNGPWLVKGADGGSAKPLRGGKGSTWEGGVRVPTVAWWPGKIAPNSTRDVVAGTIDLLPTCVAVAGGTVPAEPVIDGRDLSPVLFGTSTESPREAHYYFSGYNLQAVRQGRWKLAIAPQADAADKTTAEASKTNPRLYDLDADIGETTNLADKHPAVVEKLTKLAAATNDEIGGQKPKSRRPAGVAANPQPLYPIDEAPKAKDARQARGVGQAHARRRRPVLGRAADRRESLHPVVRDRNRPPRYRDRRTRRVVGRVRAASQGGPRGVLGANGPKGRSHQRSVGADHGAGQDHRHRRSGRGAHTCRRRPGDRKGQGAEAGPATAGGRFLRRPRQRPARGELLEG